MKSNYKVYALIDPRNNRVKYIGITKRSIEIRLKEHIDDKKSRKTYKAFWINKLKSLGLTPSIKIIKKNLSADLAKEYEIHYIGFYKLEGKLTNSTSGGDGIRDYRHSKETKALLKLKLTGRTLSDEHRKNIGVSSQRPCTESAKKKLRKSARKQWSNPELLDKMKERTGSNNPNYGGSKGPVCQLNAEGIILNEYNCLGDAATALMVNKKSLRGIINRGTQLGNHFYKFKKDI